MERPTCKIDLAFPLTAIELKSLSRTHNRVLIEIFRWSQVDRKTSPHFDSDEWLDQHLQGLATCADEGSHVLSKGRYM